MPFSEEVKASIIKAASDWAVFLEKEGTRGLDRQKELTTNFAWAYKAISEQVEAQQPKPPHLGFGGG